MTYQDLFHSALALIAEDKSDTDGIADYTERAPYLFAAFLNACSTLENQYRVSHGMATKEPFEGVEVDMERDFDLCRVFAPAAMYYVAAMLVLDENEALSDQLFALYSDLLSSIQNALPANTEKIINKYPQL